MGENSKEESWEWGLDSDLFSTVGLSVIEPKSKLKLTELVKLKSLSFSVKYGLSDMEDQQAFTVA